MDSTGVIERWVRALQQVEGTDRGVNGRNLRGSLAREDLPVSAFDTIRLLYFSPIHDLSSTAPVDPVLTEILQPVRDLIMRFTPYRDVIRQLDDYIAAVRAAREALEIERDSVRTVDQIIADMRLNLEITLIVAGTSHLGPMKLIDEELQDRNRSAVTTGIIPPPSYFDLADGQISKRPTDSSINLRAFASIVSPDPAYEWSEAMDPAADTQPWIMKQFAAQAIVTFYTEWEEFYRRELAKAHGCSIYDFQINYFGDLSRLRQDYVHRRGICGNSRSENCEILKWFNEGDVMIPTPANYVQLLSAFPDEELRRKPDPKPTGRDQIKGTAQIPILRKFDNLAGTQRKKRGEALDEALSDWTEKNRPRN